MDYSVDIKGHTLEYFDDDHIYLVDGLIVPSVTQIIHQKFKHKYDGVDFRTMQRASEHGTLVHESIQKYCEKGWVADLKEVRNFIFLEKHYHIEAIECERPVILFDEEGEPVCAGRFDMLMTIGIEEEDLAIADIKSTATLDKKYLGYQLNTYRIAYQQCSDDDDEITSLYGIHLKDDKRKLVQIPINEDLVKELIEEWRKQ